MIDRVVSSAYICSNFERPSVFITGGSGLLALNWYAAVRDTFDVVLGFHERMPIVHGATTIQVNLEAKVELLKTLSNYSPQFVVHTAGCTSVEECERRPDLAHHVNVKLAVEVAYACRVLGLPLVLISTDHLFSGADVFADEMMPVAPINVYGKTKSEAESRVSETCPDALVIRTNFYGWGTSYRRSFSDIILDALRQRRSITLFDDVYYTPILAESLAKIVHALVAKRASGLFNVVGGERISKYRFGSLLANIFGLDSKLITHGKLSGRTGLVLRPRDMSLSDRKVCDFLGITSVKISENLLRLREQEKEGLADELGKL